MDGHFRNCRAAIVELTNECNVQPLYPHGQGSEAACHMPSLLFQNIAAHLLLSTSEKHFEFILRANEPAILTAAWFDENLDFVRLTGAWLGKDLVLHIRGNFVDMADETLSVFKRHATTFGGYLHHPDLVPRQRRTVAEHVLKRFLRARELGIEIRVDVSINAANANAMTELCRWLFQDLDIRAFTASYPKVAGVKCLPAEAIFNAQMDILEFMLETAGAFQERELANEIVTFFEKYLCRRSDDRFLNICDIDDTGSWAVEITHNGHVYPCDGFARDGFIWDENFPNRIDENPQMRREGRDARAQAHLSAAYVAREAAKLRQEYYKRNKERLRPLYERICKDRNVAPISLIEQKICELSRLVSMERLSMIQDGLAQALS